MTATLPQRGPSIPGGPTVVSLDSLPAGWQAKILVEESGCWTWTGAGTKAGFGVISRRAGGKKRSTTAHRAIHEFLRGPIPDKLQIQRTCHVSDATCRSVTRCPHLRCVNPSHFELVDRWTVNNRALARKIRGPAVSPAGVSRSDLRPFHLPSNLALRVMVDQSSCWIWLGATTRGGYGRAGLNRGGRTSKTTAHRVVYELLVGPIPTGLHIDHTCGVRICVNPNHLEAVTPGENHRRTSRGVSAVNGRKTHCNEGHPLIGDNLYVQPGKSSRYCKICRRAYKQARKHLGRAA